MQTLASQSPLDRCFAAVAFRWDGTVAPGGPRAARRARRSIEKLAMLGVDVIVLAETDPSTARPGAGPAAAGAAAASAVFQARPTGPGQLWICVNGGSEMLRAGPDGPVLLARRRASLGESAALDLAAYQTVQQLTTLGIHAQVGPVRQSRRRVGLAAEPGAGQRQEPELPSPADLAAAVGCARNAASAARVTDARISWDAWGVEIGLTDNTDSMRWALARLADRGIGPGLLLIAGDQFGPLGQLPGGDTLLLLPGTRRAAVVSVGAEPAGVPDGVVHLPGGPQAFLALLEQLIDRLKRGVPDLDDDPSWTVHLPVRPDRDRVDETLTTLADGRFGTRGVREERDKREAREDPGAPVLASGIYTGRDFTQQLVPCPEWTRLRWRISGQPIEDERILDLRTGLLARRRSDAGGEFRSLRLAAAARPGVVGLRAEAEADSGLSGDQLSLPAGCNGERGRTDGLIWSRVLADPAGGVAAAATQRLSYRDGRAYLERRAAYVAHPLRAPAARQATERLRSTASVPFTALLAEQRAAWAARWAAGDVLIPDDPQLQLSARFALFHLQSSVSSRGEAAVGARGLSGPGYRGHVFWDTDVFVLPVLAALRPAAARSMLEYRLRRLQPAREYAAASGRAGCRFPWESARDGTDVTPVLGLIGGQQVPIRTGQAEEHVVADVAWAAWQYAQWSGDDAFLAGAGLPLLIETARYWASRVRTDGDGAAHIDGVIGPDEYHEPVDDDAFTNVLARWNLRRAADLARSLPGLVQDSEARAWLSIADALVDGYDARTGIYEQFAGYHGLERLLPGSLGRVPMAADALLGPERLERTQIVKQADVLMAYHMVPGEMAAGKLRANLDFYGPRTAHGSSLSPAIHAAVLARAGLPDEALVWLRHAARLDLDDLTGITVTGLHLATFGGLWQAIAFGFAGLRGDRDVLRIDPHLPSAWSVLALRLRFRGRQVTVTVSHDEVSVSSSAPISVAPADGPAMTGRRVSWQLDRGSSALSAAAGS